MKLIWALVLLVLPAAATAGEVCLGGKRFLFEQGFFENVGFQNGAATVTITLPGGVACTLTSGQEPEGVCEKVKSGGTCEKGLFSVNGPSEGGGTSSFSLSVN